MSICVVDGGPCQCQPSEGFPCPGVTALRAEAAQLRQYLDTAQRRASALGDEVAGLRNQLHLAEVVRASQVEGLNQGAAGWRERASQLEAEVTVLREALREIAWSRPLGRTSKMVEALEKKALAALAARKGAT